MAVSSPEADVLNVVSSVDEIAEKQTTLEIALDQWKILTDREKLDLKTKYHIIYFIDLDHGYPWEPTRRYTPIDSTCQK